MSPERDSRGHADDYDDSDYGEEVPRSVFATTWFRAILVVVVLAVVGVLALPYLLDWVGPTRLTPALKGPVVSAPSPPRPAAMPNGAPPGPASPRVGANPAQSKAEGGAPPTTPTPGTPPGTVAKPAPAAAETSKPENQKPAEASAPTRTEAAQDPGAAKAPAPKRPARMQVAAKAGGPYWVQVGAFHEEAHAKALAARLRGANFPAEVVAAGSGGVPTPSAERPAAEPAPTGDKYDVFVSGASAEDVSAKISAKGLSAEPVAGGAVVKPSLSLRDAVSLSKDLASDGMKVQVRRASAGPAAERPAAAGGGGTVYRVRIGGFADRTTADEARKTLSARGYNGFVGRGDG